MTLAERETLKAKFGPQRGEGKFLLTLHHLMSRLGSTRSEADREAVRLHLLSHPAAKSADYVRKVNKTWGAK